MLADFYDLGAFARLGADDITLFKNGGGAHLDLMTSRYILGSGIPGPDLTRHIPGAGKRAVMMAS